MDEALEDRYRVQRVLGQGGMGEVLLARDRRVGRDVALKAIRSGADDDLVRRFEREARVQGRLEHPGVVPVYDVGASPDGGPYFTMKRVRGRTLDEVLGGLAAGDSTRTRYSRRRLLTVFASICQTLHFAHERGVVHRDLKPANIMLGDFGEVYVLDWGIAKIKGEIEALFEGEPRVQANETDATASGVLLGTLGYMAPEQLSDASLVTPAADIYALGCLLFEMLALERVHPGPTGVELATTTLGSVEPRIRGVAREKGLPPELERACVVATAVDPAERYGTAAMLLEDIERFLDGDRDVEARSKLADAEASAAARAIIDHEADPELGHARALQHAGRALALAPHHVEAQKLIVELLLAPPARVPPAVDEVVEGRFLAAYRRAGRMGALVLAPWLVLVPSLFAAGPRSAGVLAAWTACVAASIVLLVANGRAERRDARLYFGCLVACSLAHIFAGRVLGGLGVMTGVVTITTVIFFLLGKPAWQAPTAAVGGAVIAGPLLLERAGLLPTTTVFADGGMCVIPTVVELPDPLSPYLLLGATMVLYGAFLGGARYLHSELTAQARLMAMQNWRLTSLIPKGTARDVAPVRARLEP